MRQDLEFEAGGVTLRGWLYTPDGASGQHPTVVMAPHAIVGALRSKLVDILVTDEDTARLVLGAAAP